MFARYSEHDNLYAHPLVIYFFKRNSLHLRLPPGFSSVIDTNTDELLAVDFPPYYVCQADTAVKLSSDRTPPVRFFLARSLAIPNPWQLQIACIPRPKKSGNFLPDLIAATFREGQAPIRLCHEEGIKAFAYCPAGRCEFQSRWTCFGMAGLEDAHL